jgi:hypothetical protein
MRTCADDYCASFSVMRCADAVAVMEVLHVVASVSMAAKPLPADPLRGERAKRA